VIPKLTHPKLTGRFRESILESDLWIAEKKYDGMRVYVCYNGGKVSVVSSRGVDRTSAFSLAYNKDLEGTMFDAELYDPRGFEFLLSEIARTDRGNLELIVFDVPVLCGKDLRREPLSQRRLYLISALAHVKHDRVLLINQRRNKLAFYEEVVAEGGEGIVLKKLSCGYGIDWVKVKKARDTSVVVLGNDPERGERSFRIGVMDGVQARAIGLGHIALPERILEDIRAGETVVDIAAASFDVVGRSFRHPRFVKVREDLSPLDCTLGKVVRDFEL